MPDSQGPALHLLHGSPATAIAFHDPKLCAVVVASHSRWWVVGQVVDVTLPAENRTIIGCLVGSRTCRARTADLKEGK